MTSEIETGRAGALFEDFLKDEGIYEESMEVAIKRVVAFQLAQAMKDQKITKVEMARRLETSRSQLDRLLDPNYTGITLSMLTRAAKIVGRGVKLEFV